MKSPKKQESGMKNLNLYTFASFLVLLAGCSDGATITGDAPTYIRDIEPLVQAKCVNCHTDGGIAPFALETYEQVHSAKGAVVAAVVARTMPPWSAAKGCTDYRGDISLTDDQIDMLSRWVDAGAPLGDPNDAPIPVTNERISLSRVDLTMSLPTPYTPKVFPDDYRCFFLDWPAKETTYVTGLGVEPGNESIVHHAIAYVVRPANIPVFQTLDDADSEPGWPCFGGPGGEGTGAPAASWLGGRAPGGNGEDFPEGTGIEVPAGAKVIVQIHYNSLSASPAPDQTKVLVRTDAAVQKKAAIAPFANIQWVLGGQMTIPAHSKDVVHSYSTDLTSLVNLMTGGAISGGKPLTLYSAGLHMHTRGTSISTRVDRADGTSECHTDVPRWNFHWQRNYTFQTPKQVVPGDKLHLECRWDNPSDINMNWGENTDDEMCLAPYYVTE
jgi:hypothetical protein